MGSSGSKSEKVGSKDAPHLIKIEFCGGWGYYRPASQVVERIEAKYPGKFCFELTKDKGVTSRLEVTAFMNKTTQGIPLHQKSRGEGYPQNNWDQLFKRIDEQLVLVKWNFR